MADGKNEVHWIEVKLHCDGELAEALADVLGRFVSNGVVLKSTTQFNALTHDNEPTGDIIVSGYLGVNAQTEEKRRKLEEALWHMSQITPVPQPIYTPLHDEDWMAAWTEHYIPIPVGDKLLITPPWEQSKGKEERVVIRINPAMAFGTGAHPTTQICLRLMEGHLLPGDLVMDVGCGSGILSIAALKLGAVYALAVDKSDEALTSTRENAQLNGFLPSELEVGKGSVAEILAGCFNIQQARLVMVNILTSVILQLFELGLADLVSPGGKLLLAGILDDQAEQVLLTAEDAGLRLVEKITQGDWVGFAMERKDFV